MIYLKTEIEKYESNGEKTGWSYVHISQEIADQIKPNSRRGFRVKGFIDELAINGLSATPIKEDGFIIPLNKNIRKALKKEEGAVIELQLEFDADFKIEMPEVLEVCLAQEEGLLEYFLSLPKSHQNYFINWLNTAKTEPTLTKRLVMLVNAMALKQDFGLMIRSNRQKD
ncbi:YdeI/OmpD-associated family protein [Pedobacter cryotolerans]|uniref:DUF1905 domain-containing protein n=1 Tax=Pedobacter cryotolerans TaxID=2571270 RepID=A0A4U1C7R9_9SPHI|nr:YdeI/OmpD-associated family protein [Pedobacter cryotolerans]TKC01511.1 DUF1905 domain-containing protein [Pedobacter cryotolerans]